MFLAFPQLDLAVTHIFYGERHAFYGTSFLGRTFREIFRLASYTIFAAFVLAYISARLYARKRLVPTGRNLAFLALTLALGPGLLVNGLIKEHSHRPRPFQTQDFGGTMAVPPVRPFRRAVHDGLLVRFGRDFDRLVEPRAGAVDAAALARGGDRRLAPVHYIMGVERIAYGGHYLSDVMFGALINWALVLAAAMSMRIRLPDADLPVCTEAHLCAPGCAR